MKEAEALTMTKLPPADTLFGPGEASDGTRNVASKVPLISVAVAPSRVLGSAQVIQSFSMGRKPVPRTATVLPTGPEAGCKIRRGKIVKLAAPSLPLVWPLARNSREPKADWGTCAVAVTEPLASAVPFASVADPTPLR